MNKKTVVAFIEAINAQDLDRIIWMMAEDFWFIDTWGNRENKEQMKAGWRDYLAWFPDYRIEVDEYVEGQDFSVIIGKASASYKGDPERYWEFPACRKAIVTGDKVRLWQVFCDSKKQLDSMQ